MILWFSLLTGRDQFSRIIWLVQSKQFSLSWNSNGHSVFWFWNSVVCLWCYSHFIILCFSWLFLFFSVCRVASDARRVLIKWTCKNRILICFCFLDEFCKKAFRTFLVKFNILINFGVWVEDLSLFNWFRFWHTDITDLTFYSLLFAQLSQDTEV